MASSKIGFSAHQLHRMLGTNCETAWFLFHRLREASKDVACSGPLSGESRTVEADETHIGDEETNKHAHKRGKVGGGKGGNMTAYPLKDAHLVTDGIEDPRSILLADQKRFFEAYPQLLRHTHSRRRTPFRPSGGPGARRLRERKRPHAASLAESQSRSM
jgi:hypothetical protein